MLSVVIPVYEEEGSVGELARRLVDVLDRTGRSFEIIFVDDGSTDRTPEVLAGLGRADERVRVLRMRRNSGQSAAFDAGFRAARGRVVVTLDAEEVRPARRERQLAGNLWAAGPDEPHARARPGAP